VDESELYVNTNHYHLQEESVNRHNRLNQHEL